MRSCQRIGVAPSVRAILDVPASADRTTLSVKLKNQAGLDTQAHPLQRIRDAAYIAGQWCAVLSLFVVPLNKPATNIAIGLTILFSLLGSDMQRRWLTAARHPVVQGALVWWLVLMLSALHAWYDTSAAPVAMARSFVWACWYPLVLGSLLQTPQWRRRALLAFVLSMSLVLFISYGMDLGFIPQRTLVQTSPFMRNTVFKEYTQQGLAELILAALALAWGLVTQSKPRRILLYVLAGLTLINIVLMLESRTTYVTLIPLIAYWVWRLFLKERVSWRSISIICVLTFVALGVIWCTPAVRERLVISVVHETELYAQKRVPTATGIRLELWRRTLPIIAAAPIFGHGLQQWYPLYRQSIEGLPDFDAFLMGHPHQEMLLILAEQGIAGLLIFLFLMAKLARYIQRLSQPDRDIYASILIIYLVAGLANCLWDDFSHRHLFILLLACIPPPTQRELPIEAQARLT